MSSSIFLIGPDNQLTELTQAAYDSEALFQRLLADHPDLLGIASGSEGRLLLVRREFGVPEDLGGAERWSLDHLFLDKNGVPILVEVKRATDTRARREVVAQMLDYAANGVAYWPLDRIMESFRETCTAAGLDPDNQLSAFLDGADPESYWRQVEANLRSGRVRLVFVADRIAKELRRIVEFLNEQMRPAEVLAIEMEQFVNPNGMRTLVPRLVGDTERAQIVKSVAPKSAALTEDEWLIDLETRKGQVAWNAATKAINWFRAAGYIVEISDTQDSISARLVRPSGKSTWPFFLRRSSGRLELSLQYLRYDPAFASEEARQYLLDEMKALPGITISTTKTTGIPSMLLADLEKEGVWPAIQKIANGIKEKVAAGQLSSDQA